MLAAGGISSVRLDGGGILSDRPDTDITRYSLGLLHIVVFKWTGSGLEEDDTFRR
jgi:hypothetical protein